MAQDVQEPSEAAPAAVQPSGAGAATHHHHHHHHDHDHVGKGHDHVREGLGLGSETGRVGLQILATLLGGVLLICSLVATFIFDHEAHAALLGMLAAALLGAPLVWVAIKDLLHGHAHMNELVALGVLAAFALGKYQESAAIAFFMILAVLIENRTALGAQASIESLIRITPTRARKLVKQGAEASGDGQEVEVEAHELVPGDVVRVLPGDNIPADGQIVSGQSTVNQATITGESLPVDKNQGDDVFGGTINLTGAMDVRVTKAGEDTTLGKVKSLILQAESTRIPIMRMIDRYAGWYTPTVLMVVAIFLFLWYHSGVTDPWERAIAMLVIACPCALILATPTAMVAALSSAARLGVLIKSVVDLEAARNLTAMVFDKTGTLTTGELEVTRLSPAKGVEPAALLRAAASLEQSSRHPVARAVVGVARKAKLQLTPAEQVREIAGRGLEGRLGPDVARVGRGGWLLDHAPELSEQARQYIQNTLQQPEVEGLSVLFVAVGDRVLGWIGLSDNTRPQAAAAIDTLRKQGIRRLIMVTGDRESVAKRVAGQMHTEYMAEVLPHEKLELVDELKASGHKVAVVGDGVNDAPALAAGDISIAMGAAGSDVAIHSAKIALMNNNLNRIPFLIDLSGRTARIIRQNMVFSVVFILFGQAAAAAGYVDMISAAVLHVLSGLVVVFNSARLVRSGEDLEAMDRVEEAAHDQRKPRRRPVSPDQEAQPVVA
ncbi:MAG: cation-translocating P-type ATPase [Phycisphaeraceae bacterium]|nr:cation-translocating P-type ATPase [Phycisphaeraceae bacterium]